MSYTTENNRAELATVLCPRCFQTDVIDNFSLTGADNHVWISYNCPSCGEQVQVILENNSHELQNQILKARDRAKK